MATIDVTKSDIEAFIQPCCATCTTVGLSSIPVEISIIAIDCSEPVKILKKSRRGYILFGVLITIGFTFLVVIVFGMQGKFAHRHSTNINGAQVKLVQNSGLHTR
jgi:hypothetical protein